MTLASEVAGSAEGRAALRRSRIAVSAVFLLYGTLLGTWTSRIPAIKRSLDLSDGQLSVALLAFAAGAISGMQVSGRLVDRHGSARIMIVVAVADAAVLVSPGYATSLAVLAGCLYIFGAVHGTLNVAMNARAVQVQRAWQQVRQRPIMSSFHAVYSIGGFVGATAGGLAARAHLTPRTTFLLVAAAVTALALAASRWSALTLPGEIPSPAAETRRGRLVLPGVTFLGVLVFCCLVGEGAAADWSTVYLRDSLNASAGFAASGYAAFALMMTAGRLVGDRLAARLGPVLLVRCSGILAATGLAAALLINQPIAGVAGWGCLGAGLSCIAPQVFSAAGNRDPARAGQAIARVASLGFLGFLIGPVIIGAAATALNLPTALAIPAILALFVAATAPALHPPR